MKTLAETDRDLINNWYVIALSSELKEKPLHRIIYDIPYVVFRDDKGQPRALLDRCPHRGTQLSKGRVRDGQITCPYHGWRMNGEGRVTEVPSEGEESAQLCEKRRWCVPTLSAAEQDGCIWIWAGPPGVQPSGSPPWRFPHAGDPSWTSYFMITDFENEVTQLVQNFMDVPHTVFVHEKWFRKRKLMKVPMRLEVGDGHVKATYHSPDDKIGFWDRFLNPRGEKMVHTDEFIFPNLTRVDYKFGAAHAFVINSQCTPVSRYNTRVYTWIAYKGTWVARFLKPFLQFYTRRVIEQDVEIMANQGENLKIFGTETPWKSTKADELHLAIDQLREQGAERNAAALIPRFEREREFWI